MRFLKPEDFPSLEFPLTNAARKSFLRDAHTALLAEPQADVKKAVLDRLVDFISMSLMNAYQQMLEEAHFEIIREFPPADMGERDQFRNIWFGRVLSWIFNRTPQVPEGAMMDALFEFEHVPGNGLRDPWEHRTDLCVHMAHKAIRALVANRLPGQALSYFGIVHADLARIGVPGYEPPDRPDGAPVKSGFSKSRSSDNVHLDVLLGVIIHD
jgi:hypothetical protein